MLKPVRLTKFDKEVEKSKKRGLDMTKLRDVMTLLIQEDPLPEKHCNHKLKGSYKGYWDCHIEPDWILIYKKTNTHITFVRTGTHADLF